MYVYLKRIQCLNVYADVIMFTTYERRNYFKFINSKFEKN